MQALLLLVFNEIDRAKQEMGGGATASSPFLFHRNLIGKGFVSLLYS
jgi:hypothetical protein